MIVMKFLLPSFLALLLAQAHAASPYPEKTPDSPGKRMLDKYLSQQVTEIEAHGSLRDITTAEQWNAERAETRRQLQEMLGLDPLPPRTDLKPIITGTQEAEGILIENLHFQSMPGLYVTANFYRPKEVKEPLPTILYVCGHAVMKDKDGNSLGNKTGYHHHGIWFAKHGYTCLTIDTLQLGEIPGEHHGTHHLNKWWWTSRGYTPAGVEAWDSIRALDYLETRPEVDKTRFGVTGRSGGGAYSWWVAALDDRIKAAAPTAGITSMHNHVVDGCVEGHCDCMYFVNTYRWDYDRVIGLVAPRPLLICNTDKDSIFPIDGVFSLYQSARRLYSLLGAEEDIGLQIAEGPHKDVQPLNIGAFHWFERYLKGADRMVTTDEAAKKCLEPQSLHVFTQLPADQKNQVIDTTFVPAAAPATPPADAAAWAPQRDAWMQALTTKVFRAWPTTAPSVTLTKENSSARDGIRMTAFDIETDSAFRIRLYIAHQEGLRLEDLDLIALNVLDGDGWTQFCETYYSRFGKLIETFPAIKDNPESFKNEKSMFENFKWGMAYVCPRGIGPTAWEGSEKAQTQRLRRFYLTGQTLQSSQVWDIRRTVQGIRQLPGLDKTKLWLTGHRDQAVNALYASLFEDNIARLDLHEMPTSHAPDGPAYLNVLRYLDIPQAAAMAAERTRVVIYTDDKPAWNYLTTTGEALKLEPKQIQLREVVKPGEGN